jgi:transcriptional regulator with GAF, ATPase, and Fis domain
MNRERRLAETFVELADTLVADVDVVDLMHLLADRTVELLEHVDAAALILADQRGKLELAAASSPGAKVVELLALADEEGPCLDCVHSGEPVVNVERDDAARRWPRFTEATTRAGFHQAHALPMRLRTQVVGAFGLFSSHPETLDPDEHALGQALADVATIGLLQGRLVRDRTVLVEQLQSALNGRTLVEQAKGMLAAQAGISVEEAFMRMLTHARSNRVSLSTVARGIVDRTLSAEQLNDKSAAPPGAMT